MTIDDLKFIFGSQLARYSDVQFIVNDHGAKSTITHCGELAELLPMLSCFTFIGWREGPCLRALPAFES